VYKEGVLLLTIVSAVLQVAVVYTQPQQTVLQRLNYLKTQGQQK
jgi:hypothetical protein